MKSNLSFADVAHEAQGVTVVGSITQCSNGRAGTRIKVLPLPRQCYLLCSSFFFFLSFPNWIHRLLFLCS